MRQSVSRLSLLLISLTIASTLKSYSEAAERHLRRKFDFFRNAGDQKELPTLRYLILGSDRALGAGLEDPTKNYASQLSITVTNSAMSGSDPSYASLCTETIVQDLGYDVIVIDYDHISDFNALDLLLKRLRGRFPHVSIIVMNIWTLDDLVVTTRSSNKEKDTVRSFREILYKGGHALITPETLSYVLDLPDASISFAEEHINDRNRIVNDIAKKHKALVYSWDHPSDHIRNLLRHRLPLFSGPTNLNEFGHNIVARDLKRILLNVGAHRHGRAVSWESQDLCLSWYETGKVPNEYREKIFKYNNLPIGKFYEKDMRFAMELKQENSMIAIDNPFDTPKKLYLSFMASSPNRSYPRITVTVNRSTEPFEIDPIVPFTTPKHVHAMEEIGTLPPGKNVIKFKTMDKTEFPFRFVGFALTDAQFTDDTFPSNNSNGLLIVDSE